MKRLLDMENIEDPGDQRLASLFAAVRPIRPDPFRKQRVRALIGLRLNRHLVPNRTWQIVVVASLLVVGTAAAAIVGATRFLGTRTEEVSPVASPKLTDSAFAQRSKVNDAVAPSPPEVKSAEAEPQGSAQTERPSSRPPVSSGEDPTLVASAIQALRNAHDPARAQQLLTQYLKANPRGAVAEEARALSIEAAIALGDPKAGALGCRYLSLYPKGRSRALASRVCDKSK